MTYATLLDSETARQNYLAVLKPRRIVTGFSVFSGSVYVADFDYGQVVIAEENGASLTLGTSSALSAGQFYYDTDESKLYVRLSGGGNPNLIFLVVTYEIYIGTFDAHFNRVPTDNTTRVVYFDPLIKKSPTLKQSMSDAIFGYIPIESSSIELINAEHVFEKHIYDSSFNNASIVLYHWIGDLKTENIKLVMNGLMSDIDYNDGDLSINIRDRNDIFNNEFRNPNVDNFYDSVSFPNVDPQLSGKPIRQVYGRVEGFKPVNISYVSESPTTSDNRTWSVISGQTGMADRIVTVGSSSTTTRTYVSSVNGLNVGDSVWLDRVSGTDEYVLIDVVGANYIEHSASASPMTSGDSVRRAFISVINIVQNNVTYKALYKRDYTVNYAGSNDTCQFTFETTLEANLTMPNTLGVTDRVSGTVYGRVNDLTLGGPSFGANSVATNNIANPVMIILDLLKRNLLVSDSDIDTATFTAAYAARTSVHGLAIPKGNSESFPSYQDLLSDLLQATLLQLVLNKDGMWALKIVAPIVSYDYLIEDDEILKNSFSASYKYSDLVSEVTIEYKLKEAPDDPNQFSDSVESITVSSDTAKYLHKASKSKTIRTSFIFDTDATVLANRVLFALSDRYGEVSIKAKARFFETEIGNVIEISRDKLPGFDYTREVLHQRDVVVLGVDKSLDSVSITATDQKGIQDNEGDW